MGGGGSSSRRSSAALAPAAASCCPDRTAPAPGPDAVALAAWLHGCMAAWLHGCKAAPGRTPEPDKQVGAAALLHRLRVRDAVSHHDHLPRRGGIRGAAQRVATEGEAATRVVVLPPSMAGWVGRALSRQHPESRCAGSSVLRALCTR